MVSLPYIPGLGSDLRPEQPSPRRTYTPDVERWRPLVAREFAARGLDAAAVDKALYVIEGESGGNQRAANPSSSARGLVQMTDIHGVPEEQRLDPEFSIKWMADRVARQGWSDWGEGVTYEGKPFGILGTVGNAFRGLERVSNTPGRLFDPAGLERITPPATGSAGLVASLLEPVTIRPPGVDPSVHGWYDTDPTKMRWDARTLDNYRPGEDYTHQEGYPDKSSLLPLDIKQYNEGNPNPIKRRGEAQDANAARKVPLKPSGLNTGDVPYASGQGQAGTTAPLTALDVMDRAGLGKGALGLLERVNDATRPVLDPIADAFEAKLAKRGPLGDIIADRGPLGDLLYGAGVRTGVDPAGIVDKVNEIGAPIASSVVVPRTVADTALTVGPGNLLKGGRAGLGMLQRVNRAGGDDLARMGLSIVPKSGKQRMSAMQQSLDIAEEAKQAVLDAGGTPEVAKKAAQEAMRNAPEIIAARAADEAAMETERAVSSDPFTNTGKRLKGTASELSKRMGPGVVPAGGAAGDTPKVLYHGATNALEGAPREGMWGAADWKLAQSHAVYDIKRTGSQTPRITRIEVLDPAAIKPARPGEWQIVDPSGVRVIDETPVGIKHPEGGWGFMEEPPKAWDSTHLRPPGSALVGAGRTLTGELAPRNADEMASVLADEAARVAALPRSASDDTIAGLANVAKRLGDPAALVRERLAGGQEGSATGRTAPQTRQAPLPGLEEAPQAKNLWDGIVGAYSEAAGAVGGVRTLSASGDVGHIMRQGQTLGWANRKVWKDMAVKGARAYLDEGYAAAETAAMRADPAFALAEKSGLKIYQYGDDVADTARAPGFEGLNTSAVSRTLGSLPHVAGGERSMAVALNHQGFEVFKLWAKEGMEPKQLEALADVINHARGFSAAGGKVEAASRFNALFSAQYTASRFNILADPLIELAKGNTAASKLAAQNLLSLAGSNLAMLAFLGVTGEATGRWSVNANPIDGDFGQLRIGNTRIDTLAGMGPIIKTAARIVAATGLAGEDAQKDVTEINRSLLKFLENKQAPVFGMLERYLVHGQTPDVKTPRFWAEMVTPMLAWDIYDAVKENEGANKLLGIPAAIASGTGAGASTYRTAEDQANEAAREAFGGREFAALSDLERLSAIQRVPEQSADGFKVRDQVKKDERARYNAMLETAGYLGKPKDVEETDSEKKKRETRNADVIANLKPDQQVQRWFWENGTALPSKEAVEKALGLGIPERAVKFAGNDRDLAATPDDAAFWKKYGGTINQVANEITADPKNRDAFAQFKYQKNYADLKATEQNAVRDAIFEGAKKNPKVEAVMIFSGQEKPNANGAYSASSQAVVDELKKLWAEFPGAQSLPLTETSKGVKTTLVIPKR